MTRPFASLLLSLSFFLTDVPTADAKWIANGIPVGAAANLQQAQVIVPDGSGGAIVAWQDTRSGSADIYAQRIDAAGDVVWVANGVPVSQALNDQLAPTLVSDGAGDAIIAWTDYRPGATSDIYAQRLNAFGVPQWAADGVAICTATGNQGLAQLVADGLGGIIVTWEDARSGAADIYVQRVNASGAAQWAANGIALCTAMDDQVFPVITTDGSSGAIVAWYDFRSGSDSDIYVRAVNFLGSPVWISNGVALCTAAEDQTQPVIVSDGAGGAVVAWQDYRSGTGIDVYVRRVSAAGAPLWAGDGVDIRAASTPGNASFPVIASDGEFGALVAWQDDRSGNLDIYARRIGAAGGPLGPGTGIALCEAPFNQFTGAIIADGTGGAIVAWGDTRDGDHDVYAQRIDAAGTPRWAADGAAVSTESGIQYLPVIALDDAGGAIIAWEDLRTGAGSDIFAQRIEGRHGYWGYPEPVVTSVTDVPADQGGEVKVNWSASGWDVFNFQTITHYSVWRALDAGASVVGKALGGPSQVGADFAGEAYWKQTTASAELYFEWVGNQTAMYLPAYAYTVATDFDSTSQTTAQHHFMVFSHASDPFTFWPSNVASGNSVDNLAPGAPQDLAAQRANSDVLLAWVGVNDSDFSYYAVYRGTTPGVQPAPGNLVATTTETDYTDIGAFAGLFFYIVTAIDVNENESEPSNVASLSPATGIGDVPSLSSLRVLQNAPNPFAGTTTLMVGLPRTSDVSLEVFDVAGRRVARRALGAMDAGWKPVTLEARDERGRPLPSGVYFCRVTGAGETVTRKMVIAR